MSDGTVELRVRGWSPVEAAIVLLIFLSAGLNFSLATVADRHTFALLGLGLIVIFVAYVTSWWRSHFYLVGAGYLVVSTAVWVALGGPFPGLGLADAAVQGFLALLFVSRYVSNADA